MRASLLQIGDLSAGEVNSWRELAAQATEPNPFFEPDYVLSAAESIGGRGLGVVVVAGADGWEACLPVHRPRSWHRVPLGCRAAWVHRYCFLGTPLVVAGREEVAVTEMIRELTRQRRVAFLGLDALADEGPVREALRLAARREGGGEVDVERHRRAVLRRRASHGDVPALRGKHRRELSRKRRRLEDELGDSLQTVDRAEDRGAVEEFLRLEASGWKGRRGTALASLNRDADFFRAVCASFRRMGRLHLLSLQAGRRSVAMACNLRAGEGVFCIKIAYDERWRRHSPGAQLVLDHVSWFEREQDASWMDSCVQPQNEFVNRLWPDSRAIATVAIPGGSASGRIARAEIAGLVRLRRRRAARR